MHRIHLCIVGSVNTRRPKRRTMSLKHVSFYDTIGHKYLAVSRRSVLCEEGGVWAELYKGGRGGSPIENQNRARWISEFYGPIPLEPKNTKFRGVQIGGEPYFA